MPNLPPGINAPLSRNASNARYVEDPAALQQEVAIQQQGIRARADMEASEAQQASAMALKFKNLIRDLHAPATRAIQEGVYGYENPLAAVEMFTGRDLLG